MHVLIDASQLLASNVTSWLSVSGSKGVGRSIIINIIQPFFFNFPMLAVSLVHRLNKKHRRCVVSSSLK